nr:hypothetical protein [Tanacetum cinerariifolium]
PRLQRPPQCGRPRHPSQRARAILPKAAPLSVAR